MRLKKRSLIWLLPVAFIGWIQSFWRHRVMGEREAGDISDPHVRAISGEPLPTEPATPPCWWKCRKVLWFNIICAVFLALEPLTGLLQPHVPVNVYLIFAIGVPLVNAILRAIKLNEATAK